MVTSARILLSISFIVGGFLSGGGEASAQDYGSRILGGVNLNAYCVRHHGPSYKAVVAQDNVLGWRCENHRARSFGISVQRACEETYRQRPIRAITVGNRPGDWRCRWGRRPPLY